MKRKIPLSLRKAIEEVAVNYKSLFTIESNESALVAFKDKEKDSDFYYNIVRANTESNNQRSYLVEYKPINEDSLSINKQNMSVNSIKVTFTAWLKLILEINKESPIFDDPIVQSYYDELETEFEILDEDAEVNAYSIVQQRKIIEFLSHITLTLQSYEEYNDYNKAEIKEITDLVEETKEMISRSTKREVFNKIRKVFAKIFKLGLEIGEKILIEFSTEFAKKIITGN
jgi:hypothetical protein